MEWQGLFSTLQPKRTPHQSPANTLYSLYQLPQSGAHLTYPQRSITFHSSATLNLRQFPVIQILFALPLSALQGRCSSIQVSQGSGVTEGKGVARNQLSRLGETQGAQLYFLEGKYPSTHAIPSVWNILLSCPPSFPSGSR